MLRGSAARYMQPTVKKAAKADGPLNVDSWISAAMLVLSKKGIESVRVEPLAKMLGVTKGSFYWHFNDRRALLDAMLQSWRQRATLAIIERMERGKPDPADRLRALIALPQKQASRSVDGAIPGTGYDPRNFSVSTLMCSSRKQSPTSSSRT